MPGGDNAVRGKQGFQRAEHATSQVSLDPTPHLTTRIDDIVWAWAREFDVDHVATLSGRIWSALDTETLRASGWPDEHNFFDEGGPTEADEPRSMHDLRAALTSHARPELEGALSWLDDHGGAVYDSRHPDVQAGKSLTPSPSTV